MGNKFFYLCVSGKGKDKYEFIDVEKVICKNTCDTMNKAPLDSTYTPWSSVDAWEEGKVPVAGGSGTIKATKKVLFDVSDSGILSDLTILGELHFDNT